MGDGRSLRSAAPTSVDLPGKGGLDDLGTPEPSPQKPRRSPLRHLTGPLLWLGRRGRAAGAVLAGWPRRPSGRIVLPGLLIVALIALSGFVGGYVVPALPTPTSRAFALLEPPVDGQGAEIPGADDTATGGDQPATTRPADLRDWATPIATKVGIPVPAMQAYGYAELSVAASQPGCKLRWTTLAGIGKIESNHGQHNAVLAPDGNALPPILGDPLDGQHNNAAIKDTDQGRVDTDRNWDRAVGPMQFIPSTWEKFAADADGNGVADINNINDAALAAARYLCSSNRDMSTVGDWWAAILSYNALQQYANDVFQAANNYGVQSH
jgi:hypothetical protein